ncbi:CRISPR-associated protein Cas7/Cst2/DevR, subtype I-B/TNEAP [Porphyromonas gingivicanis]|uniref:CRISPR-associated protein Cas7/Cst2/DevR, subtype I-B/TNEAP n=1 Tax=Porphyromonas gingivicanis TaxID=266762 RepID=A0A0A2G351_9PORP|nr:CRISPR-associated protein Cas7/Cst2/DevR, subtype I-B/TNEAP [Porphyromonas gingivicanis]KGN97701.1 CRISPR-associated protein Cas7/Cst2/DevR, subtype I-B/TNEAP [Porphyromonas gingivicanis]
MNYTIYIRTLKRAEHTVFCVTKKDKTTTQKFYYDSQFNRSIPFSSGQQVKRSILEAVCEYLNTAPSPITFISQIAKKKLKEAEVYATCDPTYVDQLFGGWMKAEKKQQDAKANKRSKKKDPEDDDNQEDDNNKGKVLKRRSPLSISAMRGLHPLLAGLSSEDISFDRSDRPNTEVIIRDEDGSILKDKELSDFLEGNDRSLSRKWIQDNSRATGLFVSDIAIDLRRLFCVSVNQFEPEMSNETIKKLQAEGWIASKNVFGDCLVAPKALREAWIEALAKAIVNWRITSNQSRTFSLMDTLAISIGDNANLIAGSIRAKLSEEDSNKAVPIIDENLSNVETFVTLQAGGYIATTKEQANALEKAEKKLIELMMAFDYENQK